MQYVSKVNTPLGELLLACDDIGLTGAWFAGQKYFGCGLGENPIEQEHPILEQAEEWLGIYFSGQEPDFLPPLHPAGSEFRRIVWQLLTEIPYGETITYGFLAEQTARRLGRDRMSAQAIGGAVGHNPISVIVPCHRVVGADGSLTGYAGGVERKLKLLTLEGADCGKFYIPAKGTAL